MGFSIKKVNLEWFSSQFFKQVAILWASLSNGWTNFQQLLSFQKLLSYLEIYLFIILCLMLVYHDVNLPPPPNYRFTKLIHFYICFFAVVASSCSISSLCCWCSGSSPPFWLLINSIIKSVNIFQNENSNILVIKVSIVVVKWIIILFDLTLKWWYRKWRISKPKSDMRTFLQIKKMYFAYIYQR